MSEYSKYDIIVNFQGNDHSWYDATGYGYIASYIYEWNQNKYESTTTLSPWGGYWFHTPNDGVQLKLSPQIESETREKSAMDNQKIVLRIEDDLGVASSDEVMIVSSDSYSNEFRYGKDAYNLETFVNPQYIDMYIKKDDWMGDQDINGVIAETSHFSTIGYSNDELTKIYHIETNHSDVNGLVNLTWELDSDIDHDVSIIINNTIYDLHSNQIITASIEELDQMILIIGDIDDYLIVDDFELGHPYPNPFNPSTSFNVSLYKDTHVKAMIYSINGQLVETISDRHMSTGNHTLEWDASNFSSGIYFIKVNADNKIATQKLILIK